MAYYKLISAITTPQRLNVVGNINGSRRYCRITLEPGKEYEIPEDELLWQSIKECKVRVKYDKGLENILKSSGAAYTVKKCPSCGGRVLKLEYNLVEVCDEAESN